MEAERDAELGRLGFFSAAAARQGQMKSERLENEAAQREVVAEVFVRMNAEGTARVDSERMVQVHHAVGDA